MLSINQFWGKMYAGNGMYPKAVESV